MLRTTGASWSSRTREYSTHHTCHAPRLQPAANVRPTTQHRRRGQHPQPLSVHVPIPWVRKTRWAHDMTLHLVQSGGRAEIRSSPGMEVLSYLEDWRVTIERLAELAQRLWITPSFRRIRSASSSHSRRSDTRSRSALRLSTSYCSTAAVLHPGEMAVVHAEPLMRTLADRREPIAVQRHPAAVGMTGGGLRGGRRDVDAEHVVVGCLQKTCDGALPQPKSRIRVKRGPRAHRQ